MINRPELENQPQPTSSAVEAYIGGVLGSIILLGSLAAMGSMESQSDGQPPICEPGVSICD